MLNWIGRSSQQVSERDSAIRQAWVEGRLRGLLNANQRGVYEAYRAWEEQDPTLSAGQYARLFVLDIGRRWGKTTLRFLIRCEDCIRNPGRIYRYASAFQKDIDEIVNDVSRYVLETCPEDLRPKLRGNTFVFPNGSEFRLVGLDMHPDGLRGRACDGDDLSEAAFIRHLEYTIKNVLYPQYQGRPWARICLESSAPVDEDSDYDIKFVDDAKLRGAYAYRTIEDNPLLSTEEREEFIRAAGGRDHVDCRREYYNERVRDPRGTVVPEFDKRRHVARHDVPKYAHCYVGADPGTRDKFGLVVGHWDFARCKLVIQASWAERNAGLSDVAAWLSAKEQELWGVADVYGHGAAGDPRTGLDDAPHETPVNPVGHSLEPLLFWNGVELCPNPFRRVSDTDSRTIMELGREHGIQFGAAEKKHAKQIKEAGSAKRSPEARLYRLRNAFLSDQIEIWPDSGPLEEQLVRGKWNAQRTDFERSDALGHLDCLKALQYMLDVVVLHRHLNPNRPEWVPGDQNVVFYPSALKQFRKHNLKTLDAALGNGSRFASKRRYA